jgi:hypothetical protein
MSKLEQVKPKLCYIVCLQEILKRSPEFNVLILCHSNTKALYLFAGYLTTLFCNSDYTASNERVIY